MGGYTIPKGTFLMVDCKSSALKSGELTTPDHGYESFYPARWLGPQDEQTKKYVCTRFAVVVEL